MRLEVSAQTHVMPFRDPFRIARAEDDRAATTVIVQLRLGTLTGVGEAYPVTYYGETPETVAAVLPFLAAHLDGLGAPPADLTGTRAWLAEADARLAAAIGGHGAAKAAIDIGLHDLAGKALGIAVHALIGTSPDLPPTDFTIGIDEPALVAERARRAGRFPALKIKVGGPADLETLEAVRAVYAGPIRVDANTGWAPGEGERLVPELVRLGVELIEQPFPAHRIEDLRRLQAISPLPIVADESAVTIEDLDLLVGAVAGVNVKIMKCGGIGPGLAMIRRAKALGFRVFLGCMEESSIAIAAAATLAAEADWVDLDGNLLLAHDPYTGIELGDDCRWRLGDAPGLGVHPRPA